MSAPVRAFICGCEGVALSDEERRFVAETQPWGLILFKRNVESPAQLRRLTATFRDTVGNPAAPVLIDQEGGRVQRMGPPHWPAYPAAGAYSDQAGASANPAAALGGRLVAADLRDAGITVDCAPVLDIPVAGSNDKVLGNRAFGLHVDVVADLGRAFANGLIEGGVLPVIKHIPGHGRAKVDSHFDLPVVDTDLATLERTDFLPFMRLAGLPAAMTAHVVYTAIDSDRPATTSKRVQDEVIRGLIGFSGLLFSDDLSMEALKGTLNARATAAAEAGCDILLHCNGKLSEAREVAAAAPVLDGKAAERAAAALGHVPQAAPRLEPDARARFATLMSIPTV